MPATAPVLLVAMLLVLVVLLPLGAITCLVLRHLRLTAPPHRGWHLCAAALLNALALTPWRPSARAGVGYDDFLGSRLSRSP